MHVLGKKQLKMEYGIWCREGTEIGVTCNKQQNELIDFNSMSTYVKLFYAKRLENFVYCMFIFFV